jgi:predicted transcriptional regulator
MNEIIPINPEELEIAQTYLTTQSITETARMLGINDSQVSQYLRKPEVKNYLDSMYLTAGYRNRFKIAETLDNIIEKKLSEMVESDMGSTKDIADLLALAHKMRMEEIKAMNDHEKAKNATPKVQTNVQINESPFGSGNYGKLLETLLTNDATP